MKKTNFDNGRAEDTFLAGRRARLLTECDLVRLSTGHLADRPGALGAACLGRLLAALFLVLFAAAAVSAGTVTGVVQNGTNGKPAAGVDVILIQLQGGMQPVANTKTDAQGKYTIDNPAIGQGPMLIRAVYRGVMFHQPLTPGKNAVDVTVYEPSSDAKTVQVGSRLIVFQPDNASLLVGEEYALQNQSQPPVAYFNQKGDFNFDLPQGGELSQVSSWGPSGMPVVQGTIDRGKQQYAIAYAFQPGDNGVRLSYKMPYASNHATLQFTSPYAVQRVMLVAPPTVQVTSAGFSPAGTEQGFNLYTRDAIPSGASFSVSVSGTAPPPSASQQGQEADGSQGAAGQMPPQGGGADPVNGRDSGVTIQALPNRLDSLKWILVAGFAALFALGVLMIWRRPVAAFEGAEAAAISAPVRPVATKPAATNGPRASRKQVPAASPPVAPALTPPVPASSAAPFKPSAPLASEIDRDVEQSLDGLKDRLFRLELRRQAGTISEEEYAQERARTEQILRELVRG